MRCRSAGHHPLMLVGERIQRGPGHDAHGHAVVVVRRRASPHALRDLRRGHDQHLRDLPARIASVTARRPPTMGVAVGPRRTTAAALPDRVRGSCADDRDGHAADAVARRGRVPRAWWPSRTPRRRRAPDARRGRARMSSRRGAIGGRSQITVDVARAGTEPRRPNGLERPAPGASSPAMPASGGIGSRGSARRRRQGPQRRATRRRTRGTRRRRRNGPPSPARRRTHPAQPQGRRPSPDGWTSNPMPDAGARASPIGAAHPRLGLREVEQRRDLTLLRVAGDRATVMPGMLQGGRVVGEGLPGARGSIVSRTERRRRRTPAGSAPGPSRSRSSVSDHEPVIDPLHRVGHRETGIAPAVSLARPRRSRP